MNYLEPNLGVRKRLELDSSKETVHQDKKWALPYSAIAPTAMLADAIIIVLTSALTGIAYHLYEVGEFGNVALFCGHGAIVAVLFIAVGKSNDLYSISALLNSKSQIRLITLKWVAIFAFLSITAFTMKISESFSRGATISFAFAGLVALINTRIIWKIVLTNRFAVRRFSGRAVALMIEEPFVLDTGLREAFTRQGLQVAHQFVLPSVEKDVRAQRDAFAKVISSIRGSNIEEIVVAADVNHWPELNSWLSHLKVFPFPVNLVPMGSASDLFRLRTHIFGDGVAVELQRGPRTFLEDFVKRTIDIVVAGAAIVLLMPLFLMTAIAIKLDSPGPIIFRQRRSGFNGKLFQILKFRTMSVQEDGETIEQAKLNDYRVTGVGNWLRRTSIDELPQLFNVLRGTMSIVGPRPHAIAHDTYFDKMIGKYAYRSHVKPGITGWAQVNGCRGRTAAVSDIERRVQFDLWYIENWTLYLDLKIMVMTALEIIRGKNAY